MDMYDTDIDMWNLNEEKNLLIMKFFWDFEPDHVSQPVTERSSNVTEVINFWIQKLQWKCQATYITATASTIIIFPMIQK